MKLYILTEYDALIQYTHVSGVYSSREKALEAKESILLDARPGDCDTYFYRISERELDE